MGFSGLEFGFGFHFFGFWILVVVFVKKILKNTQLFIDI